jgi:hypothetical protein
MFIFIFIKKVCSLGILIGFNEKFERNGKIKKNNNKKLKDGYTKLRVFEV